MLVMAIEAARQCANPSNHIVGYKIKDVLFRKALLIPPTAENVETEFCLLPIREVDHTPISWNEFSLRVFERNEWFECCRGFISVDYSEERKGFDYDREQKEEQSTIIGAYRHGLSSCASGIDSRELYKNLDRLGLCYGSSFQALRNVLFNDFGEAIASMNLRHWTTHVAQESVQPHVIHPSALDGFLQLMFSGFSQGGKIPVPTMIPTSLDQLWISDGACRTTDDDSVKIFARSGSHGRSEADSLIVVLKESNKEPCVIVKGLKSTKVSGSKSPSSSHSGIRRLCYRMEWRPDLDLLDKQQITAYCTDQALRPFLVSEEMVAKKELLCFLVISNVIPKLVSKQNRPLNSHLRRYIGWMNRQVEKYAAGTMDFSQSNWKLLTNDDAYLDKLCTEVEQFDTEGKVLVTVARNLLSVLEGKIDPLDLLFRDSLLEDYYHRAHGSAHLYEKLDRYIDALAHKNPNMEVLEIGAGTGGTTKWILGSLRRHGHVEPESLRLTRYNFTDISPGFFEKAKENFSAYTEQMTFNTLDIEKDPQDQDDEKKEYDIIIAANVRSILVLFYYSLTPYRFYTPLRVLTTRCKTLGSFSSRESYFVSEPKHSLTVSHSGGKLILVELSGAEVMRVGFVFGLLPGWWRGEKRCSNCQLPSLAYLWAGKEEIRKWSPHMSVVNWDKYLRKTQFSGVENIFHDSDNEQYRMSSVMISTALKTTERSLGIPETFIVANTGSPVQKQIAQDLKVRLEAIGSPKCEILTFQDLALLHRDSVCIFIPELETSFLCNMTEETYMISKKILTSTKLLLWITNGEEGMLNNPTSSMITGLSRAIRSENGEKQLVTLELHEVRNVPTMINQIAKLWTIMLSPTSNQHDTEYKEKDGMLYISRLTEADDLNLHVAQKTQVQRPEFRKFGQKPIRPLSLRVGSPGLLNTLEFFSDSDRDLPLGPDEVEIEVVASGLNFRDTLVALGQISDKDLGFECAGVITRVGGEHGLKIGDRACCWVEGSFKTYVRCNAATTIKIPDSMTFSSAAALPVIFCTAYYALLHVARIQPGESILIHSAAGGTGQAAIQLAQCYRADIYVTVGSEEKKELIKRLYGICEDHIFSSRATVFALGIKRMTKGRGVDIVLNSLTGTRLRASWECMAPFGRFIEIGKKDIFTHNSTIPMLPFAKNVMFAGVDLLYIYRENKALLGEILKQVMTLMEAKKISTPTPLHIFNASQIEEAYRYLQSGRNTGKVVVQFDKDDLVPVGACQFREVDALC